ncbi:unnamed protein product [Vitrella brassicaformis CCMP3155]|uniref:Fe-S metabolism associated domain-containing protein n=1 Tax=Vitrella brassicaformis (strain CCMP3155) TaxID=1169540 RepID=A0A0G4E9G0_VITBC|nr:unnamed protein product [Vitrella brassicaformis CCMP3155]|eukprot:CEL92512.1 unnamed protein product [Vitrella brassicaformis CCMP3155]
MVISRLAVAVAWQLPSGQHQPRRPALPSSLVHRQQPSFRRSSTVLRESVGDGGEAAGDLPPKLRTLIATFRRMPDDRFRYQQLLVFAKGLKPMNNAYKTKENKVKGCLSVVHVHAEGREDDSGDMRIYFQGDSDGLLTKGLVNFLVQGLSGCTPRQIESVPAAAVMEARVTNSLTPGRNNGFLNMLETMKAKARDIAAVQGRA